MRCDPKTVSLPFPLPTTYKGPLTHVIEQQDDDAYDSRGDDSNIDGVACNEAWCAGKKGQCFHSNSPFACSFKMKLTLS